MKCLVPLSMLLLSSVRGISAQNHGSPREHLNKAIAASSLDQLNSRPWHAKLSIQIFDSKGQDPIDGAVEYWKSGSDTLRITTFGTSVQTELRHDGKAYLSVVGVHIPYLVDELFNTFLHPGPSAAQLEGATPELRKQSFGKVSLNCIMLTQQLRADAPTGLFPTFCIDPQGDHLRVIYDFGTGQFMIQRVGAFLDKDIATEITFQRDTITVAAAKVLSLTTFDPTPETFQPTESLKPTHDTTAKLSNLELSKLKLSTVAPIYPGDPARGHVTGKVILHVLVGRDGHVRTVNLISAPNSAFALSAMNSVRQWTFKPFLMDAEPVEVESTVDVNYGVH